MECVYFIGYLKQVTSLQNEIVIMEISISIRKFLTTLLRTFYMLFQIPILSRISGENEKMQKSVLFLL